MEGRRAAESLMQDRCTIRRDGGTVVTDPLTGATTTTPSTVYAGKCKIQQSVSVQTQDIQGRAQVLGFYLHLPMSGASANVVRGDVATIDVCVNDAALVNRTLMVTDLALDSYATARRLAVDEVA